MMSSAMVLLLGFFVPPALLAGMGALALYFVKRHELRKGTLPSEFDIDFQRRVERRR